MKDPKRISGFIIETRKKYKLYSNPYLSLITIHLSHPPFPLKNKQKLLNKTFFELGLKRMVGRGAGFKR